MNINSARAFYELVPTSSRASHRG